MTLDEILIEIKNAETIVISAHESPDGDAIGSCMAMKLILEKLGKNPDVIIPEYSRLFNFLPEIDEVKKESDVECYDLAISLDCANLARLVGKEYFEKAKKTIVIDDFTAELIRKGVNVSDIYKKALRTQTKANFLLSKRAIERMEILEDGKVTFTYIDLKDEKEVNAEPGDHEGLVELGRDIEDVEVSIFVREKEENTYRISLRSGNYVNVSDVCLVFGGGGHQRAAGATIQGTLEEVKERILKEVKKAL